MNKRMLKGLIIAIFLVLVSVQTAYGSTAYINGTAVDPGGDGPTETLTPYEEEQLQKDYLGSRDRTACTNQEMLAAKILDTGDCFMENFMNDLTNAIEAEMEAEEDDN